MNHEQARSRLSDFVDRALPAAEMQAIERHLAGCDLCRREVAELQSLLAKARTLPSEIEPPRDLWPSIAARIETSAPQRTSLTERLRALAPRWTVWTPELATAAVAVLVIVLTAGPRTSTAPATIALSSDPLAVQMITSLEAECLAGEMELASLTTISECPEKRSLVESILGEIRTIDAAIAEVKSAWSTDPDSPQLVRLLTSYYRAKAVLQGRATEVAARVTC